MIPDFKGEPEARCWGVKNRGNKELLKELKASRVALERATECLEYQMDTLGQTEARLSLSAKMAFKMQFLRNAYEEMEKTDCMIEKLIKGEAGK